MTKSLRKNTIREITQTKARFLSILAIIGLGVGFFVGVKAVSYTHLDVYKRQELTRNTGEYWYKNNKWYTKNPELADDYERTELREETIYFVITTQMCIRDRMWAMGTVCQRLKCTIVAFTPTVDVLAVGLIADGRLCYTVFLRILNYRLPKPHCCLLYTSCIFSQR